MEVRRHVVKPAESTWIGRMPLSELDQTGFTAHTNLLSIYKNPTNTMPNKKHIVDSLKNSLSRVLVPYYPLAGRLHWVGDGGRLELECNAMGAELIEAESSTKKVSDLGDFSSCFQSMFQGLIPQIDYINTPLNEIPILLVQITWFKCGGVSICATVSHVVIDGNAIFRFLREFAKLTRGDPPSEELPYFDRSLLSQIRPEYYPGEFVDRLSRLPKIMGSNNSLEERNKETLTYNMILTKQQVAALMMIANYDDSEKDETKVGYGRVDAIVAHIWRCVSKARDLKDHQMTALCLLFDARSRFNPPLPPRYFGDAVLVAVESIPIREVVSSPLNRLCRRIREMKKKIDDKYVRSTIKFFGEQKSLFKYQERYVFGGPEGVYFGNPNIMVSSVLNFNMRGLDFGWGKEIYFGCPYLYDGDFVIWPGYEDDGSIVVTVSLQVNSMHKFKKFFYEGIDDTLLPTFGGMGGDPTSLKKNSKL